MNHSSTNYCAKSVTEVILRRCRMAVAHPRYSLKTTCRKLTDLVATTPDATLAELRAEMKKKARVATSLSTICRGLQALGLARKEVETRRRSFAARARRVPRPTKPLEDRRPHLS